MAEYASEIPTTMWNEDAIAAPIICKWNYLLENVLETH